VLKLGATKSVWVKISAPYRNGAAGESFAKEAYPLLRNAYGLDRLLWGSDWPHTLFEASATYGTERRLLDQWLPDPSERAIVLGETPARRYRFSV
jgi:predicted TIM-barrel fold metal-dependent hydrolase